MRLSVSRVLDMKDRRLWAAMAVVVLAVWLVGAAVTKYSLEQMAYYTPLAVVVVGATVALVLLWVKVVLDSLRRRRGET
jgi:peptidoglycan/LPS O-acetylase OafA/YrhL